MECGHNALSHCFSSGLFTSLKKRGSRGIAPCGARGVPAHSSPPLAPEGGKKEEVNSPGFSSCRNTRCGPGPTLSLDHAFMPDHLAFADKLMSGGYHATAYVTSSRLSSPVSAFRRWASPGRSQGPSPARRNSPAHWLNHWCYCQR